MIGILIVDDESIIRRGLQNVLNKQEDFFVVGAASNGAEALTMIEQWQPDIVITDINMPNIDGLELLERLHGEDEELTVIVLSGYDQFAYAQRALRAGAADYLLKPVAPEQLLSALRKEAQNIEKRRQARQRMEWLEQRASEQSGEGEQDMPGRMMALIRQRWNDPLLTMDTVAEALGLNANYLREVFRSRNGMSFVKYIRQYRLERAAVLLKTTAMQVQAVSQAVGYQDSAYFTNRFRDAFGLSPRDYREQSAQGGLISDGKE